MVRPSDQRLAEAVEPVDFRAVRQLTGRVDRRERVGVVGAELTDRVEILQRQPEWVHCAVTRAACRILAVMRESGAQRSRRLTALVFGKCRDVERRLWRRRAKQAIEDPGAAYRGRRAIGI